MPSAVFGKPVKTPLNKTDRVRRRGGDHRVPRRGERPRQGGDIVDLVRRRRPSCGSPLYAVSRRRKRLRRPSKRALLRKHRPRRPFPRRAGNGGSRRRLAPRPIREPFQERAPLEGRSKTRRQPVSQPAPRSPFKNRGVDGSSKTTFGEGRSKASPVALSKASFRPFQSLLRMGDLRRRRLSVAFRRPFPASKNANL